MGAALIGAWEQVGATQIPIITGCKSAADGLLWEQVDGGSSPLTPTSVFTRRREESWTMRPSFLRKSVISPY